MSFSENYASAIMLDSLSLLSPHNYEKTTEEHKVNSHQAQSGASPLLILWLIMSGFPNQTVTEIVLFLYIYIIFTNTWLFRTIVFL